VTGIGAEAKWYGSGSLLWKLKPETGSTAMSASSKDHVRSDPSYIDAYYQSLYIQPK